jgi:hypothetical protein
MTAENKEKGLLTALAKCDTILLWMAPALLLQSLTQGLLRRR